MREFNGSVAVSIMVPGNVNWIDMFNYNMAFSRTIDHSVFLEIYHAVVWQIKYTTPRRLSEITFSKNRKEIIVVTVKENDSGSILDYTDYNFVLSFYMLKSHKFLHFVLCMYVCIMYRQQKLKLSISVDSKREDSDFLLKLKST